MGNDIEEIKSKLNIIDVLGEYLRLDKAGSNYRALCPFHNEKSPSFMISEEKQLWKCFGCQKSGDIFSFVMEIEGVEFREALKILAEKAGVKLSSFNSQKTEEANRTSEILELATKWYEYQLWEGPGKGKILKYLHDRGLRDETIKKFRLGYSPQGWRNVLTFLTKRGYKIEEIIKTGLLVKKAEGDKQEEKSLGHCYDRFRGRVMFPICDTQGKVVGYSARVSPGDDESQAKYINTPETSVYHKSKILYGIDKAKAEIKKKDFVLLVEGNMDVIASFQAGIENVAAVSGTALTLDHLMIIKRYSQNIKMLFDMDKAGEMATQKSVILCFTQDIYPQIVILQGGKDAADIVQDNPQFLIDALEKSLPAMEYFFQKIFSRYDKNRVEDKRKIAEEILEIISFINNSIEKNHWIKKLSLDLEIPEVTLTDMLKAVNLKTRVGRTKEEKLEVLPNRKKTEILMDELVGLMLIDSSSWKKINEKKEKIYFLPESDLVSLLLLKGESVNFDFDQLINNLSAEDREKVEKLFIKKKYRLDLNNNLEEVIVNDPSQELTNLLRDLETEVRKERLGKIIRDLDAAEKNKDQNAVAFLRQEFKRTSEAKLNLVE